MNNIQCINRFLDKINSFRVTAQYGFHFHEDDGDMKTDKISYNANNFTEEDFEIISTNSPFKSFVR